MFSKTKEQLNKAFLYAESLLKSEKFDPIKVKNLPKQTGAYIFYSKKDKKIAYVGRALGKEGLFQRIIKNHLSNSYTKSVFKLKISKEYNLDIKKETSDYIRNNFTFSFIVIEEKNIASFVEMILINEFCPKYNREGIYS